MEILQLISDWVKGSNWTISGGSANADGSSGGQLSQTTSPVVVGKTYKIQYTILNYVSGSFRFSYAGTSESFNASNGTYTTYRVATSTANALASSSISFIGSIDNVSVKEVLGQEVVPDSGCGSWLLEPQSTNLVTYSEDFSDSSWVKTNSSITSNLVISPDGALNADKLVEDASTGEKFTQTIRPVSNTTIYTASVFVKFAGREWIRFTDAQSSNRIHFNTKTGVFGAVTGTVISYNSIALDNGWYKLSLTTTSVATAYAVRIVLAENDNDVSYTGDGTSGVYVWGAQLEQQSYATSYIPTNGSIATRLADVANNSGNSTLINSTEGVLYAEIAALADDGTNRGIALSDGTTLNRVNILFGTGSNKIRTIVKSNASDSFDKEYTVTSTLNYHKIAIKYKEN